MEVIQDWIHCTLHFKTKFSPVSWENIKIWGLPASQEPSGNDKIPEQKA